MEHYSLNELTSHIEHKDLQLECTITLRVDVSMEHPHHYVKDDAGNIQLTLDPGWLVSLALSPTSSDTQPFSDGEPLMVCDLRYLGEYPGPVHIVDALRALGIDHNARLWKPRPAS
ncbi:MAG: hypothetical protein JO011_01565 [Ktedonobacteraceae bacterium]|nr:hypothetical protein [Ktedonobacteraceae bacterium]